ncbi:MAG: hypothetical protein A2086_01705 [Spirochaetes bacterium GWD1_27_9]|nr:MAG: hypothetical protein A2Z98_04025 [Spirochaetes bacterium GWB1_27_13]OHD20615.1 MAG: hypothetical protein A2Y34_17505 [Spirochaetes bacterium GWC1_27_15]OHD41818.1 MAG: hypothetical protein A2086_01705 [Spirochaetes bacterium GWD1_27_9]
MGITDEKTLNNFAVLDKIIENNKNNNNEKKIDFICIDTLSAFVEYKNNNNNAIKHLQRICSENNITLVVLHHPNKEGKIRGDGGIIDGFTNYYNLENKGCFSENQNQELLVLIDKKNRFDIQEYIYIVRERTDSYTANFVFPEELPHDIQKKISKIIKKDKKTSLNDYWNDIKSFLEKNETVSFDDLCNYINEKLDCPFAKGTVKNKLNEWKEENLITYSIDKSKKNIVDIKLV